MERYENRDTLNRLYKESALLYEHNRRGYPNEDGRYIRIQQIEKEIESIQKNAIPVLFASVLLIPKEDSIDHRDLYSHLYYYADLDQIAEDWTSTRKDILPDAIDLRDFFKDYGFDDNLHRVDFFEVQSSALDILSTILLDMFSKKNYANWDEVKEDLKKLGTLYQKPEYHEKKASYQKKIQK